MLFSHYKNKNQVICNICFRFYGRIYFGHPTSYDVPKTNRTLSILSWNTFWQYSFILIFFIIKQKKKKKILKWLKSRWNFLNNFTPVGPGIGKSNLSVTKGNSITSAMNLLAFSVFLITCTPVGNNIIIVSVVISFVIFSNSFYILWSVKWHIGSFHGEF